MKKVLAVFCGLAFLLLGVNAHAQQLDAAFGITTLSTAGTSSNGNPGMGGGFYPSFSVDYLFKNRTGIQGEVAWRGKINPTYGYRPILFNLNGIYAPKLNEHVTLEGVAGIGFQATRLYTGTYTCTYFGCTNYSTDKHFLADVGVGIRFYPSKNIFIRPEARWYYAPGNDSLFSTNKSTRYGITIGYTFGTDPY